MNIFLDFEATQFKENVIAIGAYCECGSFDCLVRPPKGDKVSRFITELTGITKEMSKAALPAEEAFSDLYQWIKEVGKDQSPIFYHAFGNMDEIFLTNTAQYIQDQEIRLFIENLAASLIDDSKKVCKFFHAKTIGVFKALKYFELDTPNQDHDPLNDAIALSKLMSYIYSTPELTECPFVENAYIESKINPPKKKLKKITAIHKTDKKAKPRHFFSEEEAINWAFNRVQKVSFGVSREKVALNLLKAISRQNSYLGWYWIEEK